MITNCKYETSDQTHSPDQLNSLYMEIFSAMFSMKSSPLKAFQHQLTSLPDHVNILLCYYIYIYTHKKNYYRKNFFFQQENICDRNFPVYLETKQDVFKPGKSVVSDQTETDEAVQTLRWAALHRYTQSFIKTGFYVHLGKKKRKREVKNCTRPDQWAHGHKTIAWKCIIVYCILKL